jgi:phosphinothricin acetyltransferase
MRIADSLVSHAINCAPQLGFKNLIAILLDVNHLSIRLLEKHGFSKWGHLPEIANFKTAQCGQCIYGKKISA